MTLHRFTPVALDAVAVLEVQDTEVTLLQQGTDVCSVELVPMVGILVDELASEVFAMSVQRRVVEVWNLKVEKPTPAGNPGEEDAGFVDVFKDVGENYDVRFRGSGQEIVEGVTDLETEVLGKVFAISRRNVGYSPVDTDDVGGELGYSCSDDAGSTPDV